MWCWQMWESQKAIKRPWHMTRKMSGWKPCPRSSNPSAWTSKWNSRFQKEQHRIRRLSIATPRSARSSAIHVPSSMEILRETSSAIDSKVSAKLSACFTGFFDRLECHVKARHPEWNPNFSLCASPLHNPSAGNKQGRVSVMAVARPPSSSMYTQVKWPMHLSYTPLLLSFDSFSLLKLELLLNIATLKQSLAVLFRADFFDLPQSMLTKAPDSLSNVTSLLIVNPHMAVNYSLCVWSAGLSCFNEMKGATASNKIQSRVIIRPN